MKNLWIAALVAAACGSALAKLPVPVLDDAAKAKAAEAAAKTAWQGKVDAYQLCKAQDRVAQYYLKTKASASAARPATVAAAAVPCPDPGPFGSNPPEQKPLEASGAHSPAGTATSPPSVPKTSAELQPAKKLP
jgi:hypothetical protein